MLNRAPEKGTRFLIAFPLVPGAAIYYYNEYIVIFREEKI